MMTGETDFKGFSRFCFDYLMRMTCKTANDKMNVKDTSYRKELMKWKRVELSF